MSFAAQELDAFVCGKCMYLAAALHRVRGWEIQAVIEPAEGQYPPWVGHAWCVDPSTGHCVDIDGAYPPDRNGWIRPDNELVLGLDEASLRQLTLAGASQPFTLEQWNREVLGTLKVVQAYLLPRLE